MNSQGEGLGLSAVPEGDALVKDGHARQMT